MRVAVKALTILFLVFVVVGLVVPQVFLSKSYEIERSATIPAARDAVFAAVADLRTWKEWTAWTAEADPSCEWTYAGEPGATGQRVEWRGDAHGAGSMEWTAVAAPERLAYVVAFGPGGWEAEGTLALAPRGDGTEVTWTMGGAFGGLPTWRYMGLLAERFAGRDLEVGLAGLAARFAGGG